MLAVYLTPSTCASLDIPTQVRTRLPLTQRPLLFEEVVQRLGTTARLGELVCGREDRGEGDRGPDEADQLPEPVRWTKRLEGFLALAEITAEAEPQELLETREGAQRIGQRRSPRLFDECGRGLWRTTQASPACGLLEDSSEFGIRAIAGESKVADAFVGITDERRELSMAGAATIRPRLRFSEAERSHRHALDAPVAQAFAADRGAPPLIRPPAEQEDDASIVAEPAERELERPLMTR